MSAKANIGTLEDFIKRRPEMAHLDPMNQIDFSLSDINQNELKVLKEYFTGICVDLTLYMQLFSDKNSVDELNKFNGFVFHHIEQAYLQKICLKVATLMDPPASCGKQNLSLRRFIKQTKSEKLNEAYLQLDKFYTGSGIKEWRNKVLAHADLETLSGNYNIDLKFTREEVDDFVAEIQEFIDLVSDPRVATDHRIVFPKENDGYMFVEKIRQSNES